MWRAGASPPLSLRGQEAPAAELMLSSPPRFLKCHPQSTWQEGLGQQAKASSAGGAAAGRRAERERAQNGGGAGGRGGRDGIKRTADAGIDECQVHSLL